MVSAELLVVLVNWRRPVDTIACLESLRCHAGNSVVAVCENGSADDSAELLLAYFESRFGQGVRCSASSGSFVVYKDFNGCECAVLYLSDRNTGFAAGNNLAFNSARLFFDAEYVWFLNNDTEITSSSARLLLERMRGDAQIGICGSTIVYAHDKRTVQALGGAKYFPCTGMLSEIGQGTSLPLNVNEKEIESKLSYVSGASMFVSNFFLEKVGLMCEDYFLYYEELDWSQRAVKAGFRLGYVKDSIVFHKEGASLGSGRSNRRSALSEFYGVRNRLRITRRFFPIFFPVVYFFSWLQVIRRLFQGHISRALMMVRILLGVQRSYDQSG